MKVKIGQDDWYVSYFSTYKNSPEYDMNPFKILFCKFAEWMFSISQSMFHEAQQREYNSAGKVKSRQERALEKKALAKSRLEEVTIDYDYEQHAAITPTPPTKSI